MPLRAQVFDSNGPEGRVRGNAHQVYERYLALARDATSSGDRIQAESFYQFAEHYLRILNAANAANASSQGANGGTGPRSADPGSAEQPSVVGGDARRQDAGRPDQESGSDQGGQTTAESGDDGGARGDQTAAEAEVAPDKDAPGKDASGQDGSDSPPARPRTRRQGPSERRARSNGQGRSAREATTEEPSDGETSGSGDDEAIPA